MSDRIRWVFRFVDVPNGGGDWSVYTYSEGPIRAEYCVDDAHGDASGWLALGDGEPVHLSDMDEDREWDQRSARAVLEAAIREARKTLDNKEVTP